MTAAITEESITSAFAEASTKLAVDASRFAFQVDAPSACENALKVTAKAERDRGRHSTDRAHSRARDVLQLALLILMPACLALACFSSSRLTAGGGALRSERLLIAASPLPMFEEIALP